MRGRPAKNCGCRAWPVLLFVDALRTCKQTDMLFASLILKSLNRYCTQTLLPLHVAFLIVADLLIPFTRTAC